MCHSNIILVNNTEIVVFSICGAAFTSGVMCLVWLMCFEGTLLFPLKEGKFLKCSTLGKINVARSSMIL